MGQANIPGFDFFQMGKANLPWFGFVKMGQAKTYLRLVCFNGLGQRTWAWFRLDGHGQRIWVWFV